MAEHPDPDRPDPTTVTTATELVQQLNNLRRWAGQPSLRKLKDLAGTRPGTGNPPAEALPTSTTHEILAGRRLPRMPRLEFVEPFVAACLRAGRCPPDEVPAEVDRWRRAWRQVASSQPQASSPDPTPTRHESDLTIAGSSHSGTEGLGVTQPSRMASARRRWAGRRLSLVALAVALLSGGIVVGGAAARYLTATPPSGPTVQTTKPCAQPLPSAAPPTSAAPTGRDLVTNGGFDSSKAAWWDGSGTLRTTVENSRLHIRVIGGTARRWDAIVEQRDIPLTAGRHYTLSFDIAATTPVEIRATVQMQYHPYQAVITRDITASPTPCRYSFTALGDVSTDNGVVSFQLGGHPVEHTYTLDNVSLIEHAHSTQR